MATVGELVDRSRVAYAALTTVGEQLVDEWQYVTDLSLAWSAQLAAVGERRGDRKAPSELEAAVDRLIDEIGRITDPNRAIDWLSTFPQAVLLAFETEP